MDGAAAQALLLLLLSVSMQMPTSAGRRALAISYQIGIEGATPESPSGCVHRVYLLGGASSTGTAKDTVVIYTPALIDEGIYIANLTVPEGLFWSDIINPPGMPQRDVPLLSWPLQV